MPVEDHGDPFELLQRDLFEGLSHAFAIEEDSIEILDRNIRDNEIGSVGIGWSVQTVHTGVFRGMKATDRRVVIRGFTVLQTDDDNQLQFRRYIDWSEVAAQMGMVTSMKPVRSVPPEFLAPDPE